MNIFKRHRGRTTERLHERGERRRSPRHSRDAVLSDPMTSVALRSMR
jgi:hypothetical protein